MKKAVFWISILTLLVLSGYLVFKYTGTIKINSAWELIPESANAVYEAGDCVSCRSRVTDLLPLIFSNKTAFQPDDSLAILFENSLHVGAGDFVSIHVTMKDDYSLVYYLPVSVNKSISRYLEGPKGKNVKIKIREYDGVSINEYVSAARSYFWIIIDSYLVVSESSLLIEDVIRTFRAGKEKSFYSRRNAGLTTPVIRNDAGDLYINFREFNKFLNVFTGKQLSIPVLAELAAMDVKTTDHNIVLNGFTRIGDHSADNALLSLFTDQNPASFTLKGIISNRTLMTIAYGISDGDKLSSKLNKQSEKSQVPNANGLSVNKEKLLSTIGNEIVVCFLESKNRQLTKVLLVNIHEPDIWKKELSVLEKSRSEADSLFSERYSSYEIRKILLPNFPEKLFTSLVSGFPQTYYTWYGNTLIMSERIDELRAFLNDIETEEVWGKSVSINNFIESTLLESNLSVFINMPKAMNFILPELFPLWQTRYNTQLKTSSFKTGWSAFQFSNLDGSFYTNAIVSFEPNSRTAGGIKPTFSKTATTLDRGISSKPYLARNIISKQYDFIIQDSSNTLHYISADGKQQWSKKLDAVINTNFFQVDYLANNKLQTLVLSGNKLRLIDRLGNEVKPFPVSIPTQQPEHFNVIDYDNSKRYRFIIAEKSGKIWMTDKEGKPLDGWKPKNLEGSLLQAPEHYRISGKDNIIAIRRDGAVYFFNRRGENLSGFPLSLNERLEGQYYVDEGSTPANSIVTVISKAGTRIMFNMEGKVLSRETMVKTSLTDNFGLIKERKSKAYVIRRQNSSQLSLLNADGTVILTNEYVGDHPSDIQFYDFGSGRLYYLINDQQEDLCYIYDKSGRNLTSLPIEASRAALMMDDDQLKVIAVSGKVLSIIPLNNQ